MFTVEKTTLQLLRNRENYEKIRGVVNKSLFDPGVKRALTVLDNYWQNYEGHTQVMPDVFMSELALAYPDLSDADLTVHQGMTEIMCSEPDEASAKGLMRSLRTMDFANKLEKAHEDYATGLDIDLHGTVADLLDRFQTDIARDEAVDWCRDDIIDIIESSKTGFHMPWFLDCLQGSLPDIIPGDQIILAARPGKGKTSLCARQAVHMASLTPDDRPVLWFNNEGKGRKIKGTIYRAALAKSFAEIVAFGGDEAKAEYERCVGGPDRIKIFDVHGRDYRFLESIIKDYQPAAVFFDMLDNVHGFGDAARTDLRLEQLYQWARERAVIHDFISIAVSQISVEGEGLAWCDQSMLKDSKTAKQGACEAIVMMGTTNNQNQLWSRFMYVPKQKSETKPGYRPDCAQEIIFDGARCQFKEPKENGEGVNV